MLETEVIFFANKLVLVHNIQFLSGRELLPTYLNMKVIASDLNLLKTLPDN